MTDEGAGTGEHVSPFERIRHTDGDGGEYWSARELGELLGYEHWQGVQNALARAISACELSGYASADHFRDAPKTMRGGRWGHYTVSDYALSRYACYLVVQNGDASKEIVALGQTYFAVQTRRQELAQERQGDELAGMTEAQRRIMARAQLTERNKALANAVQGAGIIEARDFAVFQDHGYRGLYAGESARDIAARKGLGKGQHILDYMGSEELAANLFRATQTEAKIRREGIEGKGAANRAHHDVGAAVRRFIIEDLGGTPPEHLPTPDASIQELRRQELRRIEGERAPSLFDADAASRAPRIEGASSADRGRGIEGETSSRPGAQERPSLIWVSCAACGRGIRTGAQELARVRCVACDAVNVVTRQGETWGAVLAPDRGA